MSPQSQPPPAKKPPPVRHASSRVTAREHRSASNTSVKGDPQRHASTRTHASARAPSTKSSTGGVPHRPTDGLHRGNTLQTRYMEMLLSLDKIPRIHNILASFFGWLLLAGFVVFPGTFTSISQLSSDPSLASQLPTASAILDKVQNLPLLIVASVVCGLGAIGLLWLSFRWRRNYVWVLNRIFLPNAINAVAGLISTLVTVYAQKDGDWSIMAKVTAGVEAAAFVICGALFVLCTLMLKWVKRKHAKEMDMLDEEDGGAGLLEKTGRTLRAPAMEPQSVV